MRNSVSFGIERNSDALSHADDLAPLYKFRAFPVFMGCTQAPFAQDVFHDMHFQISRSSGMIQINPILPPEVIYPEAHGSGCVGASWAKHHAAFAQFLATFDPQSVLEIGGGHGLLAKNYRRLKKISWTILEPNPTPDDACAATILKGFFDENFRYDDEIDAVVHSHVFEHMPDPGLFVRHLAGFLPAGKMLIFSVPNMRVMLERKFTNCLNFEHTIYLSEDYVAYALTHNGFRIVEKEYFQDDHSIFYAAVRDDAVTPIVLSPDLYEKNKELYLSYLDFHQQMIDRVNAEIAVAEADRVFLFGAHVQSQYLFGFGLKADKISKILDNDARKHGKRLYGTDKIVAGPAILADVENPIVILRAGTFTDEIVAQIKGINPRTKFLP